jgi:hypothetical protein
MNRSFVLVLIGIFGLIFSAGFVQADPKYKLDVSQKRVLEIIQLGGADGCHPSIEHGTVVTRQFESGGVDIISVTLEKKSGERTFVNVSAPKNVSLTDIAWIRQGLQTLLKIGNRVSLGVGFCGVAGRVIILDSVKLFKK